MDTNPITGRKLDVVIEFDMGVKAGLGVLNVDRAEHRLARA